VAEAIGISDRLYAHDSVVGDGECDHQPQAAARRDDGSDISIQKPRDALAAASG